MRRPSPSTEKAKAEGTRKWLWPPQWPRKGWPRIAILSAGTDGTDGPTDAAGAFADGNTAREALQRGLNPLHYLLNNDSYTFFDKLGQLFKTGPTRTNVMDVICLLVT